MNKYINVDKLIAKIKARQSELVEHIKTDTSSEKAIDGSKTVELQWVLDIIDSLQQEQPSLPDNLDEIDQWLFDSFGILPGACASTENLRYTTARMVAEALWPKKDEKE